MTKAWQKWPEWSQGNRVDIGGGVHLKCGPHWLSLGTGLPGQDIRVGGHGGELLQVFVEPRSEAVRVSLRELRRLREWTDAAIEALERDEPTPKKKRKARATR